MSIQKNKIVLSIVMSKIEIIVKLMVEIQIQNVT